MFLVKAILGNNVFVVGMKTREKWWEEVKAEVGEKSIFFLLTAQYIP